MLAGKRILVTGVATRDSIAYAAAEQAQEAGAEVILTSFGRMRRLTERAARRLPSTPDVLELDVRSEEDLGRLTEDLGERWGGIDGALHRHLLSSAYDFSRLSRAFSRAHARRAHPPRVRRIAHARPG